MSNKITLVLQMLATGCLIILICACSRATMASTLFTTIYAFPSDGASGYSGNSLTLGPDDDLDAISGTLTGPAQPPIYKITTAGCLSVLNHPVTDSMYVAYPNKLTLGRDGNFYGTSVNNFIFKLTPAGVFTTIYTFSKYEGLSDLTVGPDGNFYGTTSEGGSGYGSVFKVTLAGAVQTLYSFSSSSDGRSLSDLTLGRDGNFYGTAAFGGYDDNNYGNAFRITPTGSYTLLYTFTGGADGLNPGNLTLGLDGNLYGTTYGGVVNAGSPDYTIKRGTLFKMTPAGVLTTIYNFDAPTGPWYSNDLTLGPDGNFYSTTLNSPTSLGTVYEITTAGVLTTLHTFTGKSDGQGATGLTLGADGNLYGTTIQGGAYDFGTVFKVSFGSVLGNRYDLNDDGHPDLMWENASTGEVSTWLMNGAESLGALQEGPVLGTVAPSTGWSISAVGDIDGDGHPDLIWHNSKTGAVSTWLLNGPYVQQEGPVLLTNPDLNANVISLADFNGDERKDLLWYDSSTGELTVTLMDTTTVLKTGVPIGSITPSTGWRPIGTADFDGNGSPDVLWENSITGQHLIWYLNGTSIKGYSPVFATVAPSTGWHVKSIADYDSDGHPDLIWQNSKTGQVSVWLLNGTTGTAIKQLGSVFATVPPSTGWSIVGGK